MAVTQLIDRVDALNRAHAEARRLEALFTVQLHAAPQALLVIDQDGIVLLPNAPARALFKAAPEPLVGTPTAQLIAASDGDALHKLIDAVRGDYRRTHFAALRPLKSRRRLGVFARALQAFNPHGQAVLLYWRTGKVPKDEPTRLLAAPAMPYQATIPLDRRVIGADIDALQAKLGLNHQRMSELLGVNNNKYYALRGNAEAPIGDGAVARIIRLLDVFPQLVSTTYNPAYLRALLGHIDRRAVPQSELAPLLGRDPSSISRYNAEEQSQRAVVRLIGLLGQLLETEPAEAFEFYRRLAEAEQRLRQG